MSALEFDGALDKHLLADSDYEHDDCEDEGEPDYEQMIADRADWLAS